MLPEEIQVVHLQRRSANSRRWSDFHCRRDRVQAALVWLCEHSPAYEDVQICPERLAALPEDGELPVHVVDLDAEDDDEDRGPAPGQQAPADMDVEDADADVDTTHSGTVSSEHGTASSLRQRSNEELNELLQVHEQHQGQGDGNGDADVRFRQDHSRNLIDWRKHPYFFASTWPTLFMPKRVQLADGSWIKDVPAEFVRAAPRAQPISFHDYCKHLMNGSDGRYAAHPTLKFALLNIKQRQQALSQTKYGVEHMTGEQPLDLAGLREMIDNSDTQHTLASIANKITTWGRNVTASPPYWWARKRDVEALVRQKVFENDELPVAFITGSMAEFYWPSLHRVLSQAFEVWGRPDLVAAVAPLADGQPPLPQHRTTVFQLLQRYSTITNQVFVNRTRTWFRIVLQEGLGIEDYWYRFEFAKSRGAIHFHGLLFKRGASADLHAALDLALQAANMEQVKAKEDEAAAHIVEQLDELLVPITALHPAGRQCEAGQPVCQSRWYQHRIRVAQQPADADAHHYVVGEDVHADNVGNVHRWPPHEGCGAAPSDQSLRTRLYDVGDEDRADDLIGFVNRVMLHKCSSYCLHKATRVGKDGKREEYCKCRMHFGNENPKVEARTNGRPARSKPALDCRRGVMYLEAERDHPRLQQGPQRLCRGWGANFDLQPVLAMMHDVEELPAGQDVLTWAAATIKENDDLRESDPEAFAQHMREKGEIRRKRRYFNKDEYVNRLVDYVVAYACKGEMSANDAVRLLRKLMDSDLNESTSFRSLAQRLNMQTLKSREVPAAECSFLLQGLHLYSSPHSFPRVSLSVTQREIAVGGELDQVAGDDSVVKRNHFDAFIKAKADGKCAAGVTFNQFQVQTNSSRSPAVPVYSHCRHQATWPLTEDYSRSMLTLHKPGILSVADIKGDHETYVGAFTEFLRQDVHVPPGIKRSVQRAVLAFLYDAPRGTEHRYAERASDDEDDIPLSALDPVAQDAAAEDALFAGEPAPDGDADHAGVIDMRRTELDCAPPGYTPNVDRDAYPPHATLQNFADTEAKRVYLGGASLSLNKMTPQRYIDPVLSMDNEGQRLLLCAFLEHLENMVAWWAMAADDRGAKPTMRAVVAGVAGTGKSFVMGLIAMFIRLVTGKQNSAVIVAPTGAAAGNCGGSTADRLFSFSRADGVYKPLSKDARTCVTKQREFADTEVVLVDEISMWGCKMHGHFVRRLDEVCHYGAATSVADVTEVAFGHLSCVVYFGDFKQLPPVLDTPLYKQVPHTKGALAMLGAHAYQSIDQRFLLDQPVRQRADDVFYEKLMHLRDGLCAQHKDEDTVYWSGRVERFQRDRPGPGDVSTSSLVGTCFNKDRDEENRRYISACSNVCVVKALASGTHATALSHKSMGMAKSIPLIAYYSVGMMVKLTLNVCPEVGLYNNARGVVRDIVYENGGYDATAFPIVIVEFPEYSGLPFAEGVNPRWVPIAAVERRCDCHGCGRFGLPLVCAKADSIHSLQGLTVGPTKTINRLVLHWKYQAEGMFPGIFYVGCSRATCAESLTLAEAVPTDDYARIGTCGRWQEQHDVVAEISLAATVQRAEMQSRQGKGGHQWGSPGDFLRRLSWLIETARVAHGGDIHDDINSCLDQWQQSIDDAGGIQ